MAMNRFAYASASTVDEALEVLAGIERPDDCRPMAGGVDLLDRMKEGLISPARLVNLKRIPGLDQVREDASGLHIGALVPLYRLSAEPAISERTEMACLRQALTETASPQIRHMATIGGNLLQRPRCWYFRNKLAHCLRKGGARCFAFRGENERHAILGGGPCYIVHPSDPAVALLALDASVLIAGIGGVRTVSLADFYLLPRQDAQREVDLASNEILTEIVIPTPPARSRGLYLKVPERGARDFALVSVAVQLTFAGEAGQDACPTRGRLVLGGVAPVPWRAAEAEQALVGQALSDAVIEQASLAATAGARPLSQNAFKIELARGTVRQALRALRAADCPE
jgi:xanthine dehydrogenase YagS FAD-binding subunit